MFGIRKIGYLGSQLQLLLAYCEENPCKWRMQNTLCRDSKILEKAYGWFEGYLISPGFSRSFTSQLFLCILSSPFFKSSLHMYFMLSPFSLFRQGRCNLRLFVNAWLSLIKWERGKRKKQHWEMQTWECW